ncbi:MAG: radical SAM protein [Victivallales bacterium]|nr:radical SAM protein [Victivallales bacterium]
MNHKYLFGPVASRRLGISLGVDLVPFKTCSLNCIYCESGATTAFSRERREYVPAAAVIRELDNLLATGPKIDYLTFSGAGEPTLNSGIGQVINFLKNQYPDYKICLLTNATLFDNPQVLREIAPVDLCIPSLDASCKKEFEIINRPCPGLDYTRYVDALKNYCRNTESEVWLELFIVPGQNDSDASIKRFAGIIAKAMPDKVQLNTLDRPGTVDWIQASSAANTMRFVKVLEPLLPVEAVGPFKYKSPALQQEFAPKTIDKLILELVSRRPATLSDMTETFGTSAAKIKNRLLVLTASGKIKAQAGKRGEFYSAKTNAK